MSNNFKALDNIESKEIMPGFHGKLIHSSSMTLAYWDIDRGCDLPEHHHFHEQVVNLLEGTFELTLNGETKRMTPGMIAVIPPNVAHSGKAITDCKILDVFSPAREDYQ